MSIPQVSSSLDDISAEIAAMQTIARALANVRDEETRLRILRWTNERFAGTQTAARRPAAEARPPIDADPTLSVDGLHLFDADDGAPVPPARESAVISTAVDQPLDSLLRGFATDFRALAIQWQSA